MTHGIMAQLGHCQMTMHLSVNGSIKIGTNEQGTVWLLRANGHMGSQIPVNLHTGNAKMPNTNNFDIQPWLSYPHHSPSSCHPSSSSPFSTFLMCDAAIPQMHMKQSCSSHACTWDNQNVKRCYSSCLLCSMLLNATPQHNDGDMKTTLLAENYRLRRFV